MQVSEDIQRELVYELNALVLRSHPRAPAPDRITQTLLTVLQDEGPRFHEPELVDSWAQAAVVDPEELAELIEEAVASILEELEDEEEPWSAHRILDLLAEESFWHLRWGPSGGTLPARPRPPAGVALPLALRPALVTVLNALELRLFEAHQNQRSVHDRLPQRVLDRALDETLSSLEKLSRTHNPGQEPGLIHPGPRQPSLRRALETIQRWKLSVVFDAAPDDDDGEWTLRVLERLYDLEWMVVTPP